MRRFTALLVLLIGALALLVLAFSCDPDPYDGPDEGAKCDKLETRCVNNRFQLCSIEARWETLYDCSEFDLLCCEDGACCPIDGGAVDGGAP